MAPRARPRRSRRDKRMDAAVDAMTKNYGFSEEIVKRVVKELLKEYEGDEGDEGWFFIEQYSYQELIDAILRDQEQNDQDNPPNQKVDALPQNISLQDEKAEEHTLTDAVGPSGILTEPSCSKVVENGLETNNTENVDHLPPTNTYGKGWKDIGLDRSCSQKERGDTICHKDVISDSSQDPADGFIFSPPPPTPTTTLGKSVPSRPGNNPVLSPSPRISTPPHIRSVQSRRRQPCYGWIESDEEEEVDDFIQLTPAIEWEDLNCRIDTKAKRKSRWDLQPEDI